MAVYSRATPGVNGPKFAGVPVVSESVAGTEPPTSALEHDAAIDFDGSLSDVACSVTEP